MVPQPSVKLKSFACPHCGAHADQAWFNVFATQITGDENDRLPLFPTESTAANTRAIADRARSTDQEKAKKLDGVVRWAERMLAGEPFLHHEPYINARFALSNVFVSSCYTCRQLAVWVHDRMIYPPSMAGPPPSADLPDDLRADFEEARRIINLSPRGAAALLRLLVQKLCAHLGERGRNIDDDISSLVQKGLDPSVQQALDAVRVIGNEAVHPGQMDLRDDPDTALILFELVNDITAQTITRRKRAQEIYSKLPQGKRDAIEKRDAGGK